MGDDCRFCSRFDDDECASGDCFIGGSSRKNQELVEALADMTNIACLSPQQEETGNQDDEKAFVQLVEYARVCVMMLHTEHQGKTLKINRKMVH